MVEHNGIRITIETAAGPLPEYPFPSPEPAHTKTIYLEIPTSATPLPFQIRLTPTTPLNFTTTAGQSFYYIIDGVENPWGRCITKDRSPTGLLLDGIHITSADRTEAPPREMCFQPLSTTEDDDDTVADTVVVQELGTIEVEFAEILSITPEAAGLLRRQNAFCEGRISEKKTKGSSSSHSTRLGNELPGARVPDLVCDLAQEFFTVRFLYRSKSSLQSLGVIPYPRLRSPPLAAARIKRERRNNAIDLEAPGLNGSKRERRKRMFIDLTTDDVVPKRMRYDGTTIDLTTAEDQPRVKVDKEGVKVKKEGQV